MPSLRQGRVLVKNWHEFESKGMQAGAKVQKRGRAETFRATIKIAEKTTSGRGGRYLTEQALELAIAQGTIRIVEDRRPTKAEVVVEETRYVESDARWIQRVLGRDVGASRTSSSSTTRRITRTASARPSPICSKSTRRSTKRRSRSSPKRRQSGSTVLIASSASGESTLCVDLSATPYYLARAGAETNRIFPWVVSDFRTDRRDRVRARQDSAACDRRPYR